MSGNKTLLITGMPRGGTTLAASIFARIGVPFARPIEQARQGRVPVSKRFEHAYLRRALIAGEFDKVREIADEFTASRGTWAWKAPGIAKAVPHVVQAVQNPHLVMITKDPLPVAARSTGFAKNGQMFSAAVRILERYKTMITDAEAANVPTLLISYEKAMQDLPAAIMACAQFAGVTCDDPQTVANRVRSDGDTYFVGNPDEAAASLWSDVQLVA